MGILYVKEFNPSIHKNTQNAREYGFFSNATHKKKKKKQIREQVRGRETERERRIVNEEVKEKCLRMWLREIEIQERG